VDGDRVPGVIDTVGIAFATVNRRPYLILIPVILDLYLWIGVRLSAQPLTDVVEQWLRDGSSSDPRTIETVHRFGEQFDLLSLLSVTTPTLLTGTTQGVGSMGGSPPLITGVDWWLIPPLFVALALAGVGIGTLYLTMIGYLVRGEPIGNSDYLSAALRNIVRMYGFIVVVLGLMLLTALPILIVGGMLLASGLNLMPMLTVFMLLAILWGIFFLFFAQDAIVLSNANAVHAIRLSYNVVRQNFWPALIFVGVYVLIRSGVPVALEILTTITLGVPIAVIVNAYVATGLVAAGMIFYRDRVKRLPAAQTTTTPGRE
jgi:hypothetical protein